MGIINLSDYMNQNLKRIFTIVGLVLAVCLIAFGIYYLFFRPITPAGPGVAPEGPAVEPGGQLPEIGEGGVVPISPENVNRLIPSAGISEAEISEVAGGGYTKVSQFSPGKINAPVMTPSGGFNYFNATEGRFYRLNQNGSAERLSDQRFFSVASVTWSPSAEQAVLEYPDGSNIVYDFTANKQYSLPKEMQDFDFTASGGQLAAEAIGAREENNWLVTANTDGSNIQFIERLGGRAEDVDVNWSPNGQVVALFKEDVNADTQQVIFVGKNQENFKGLTVYGRGFEGQWTPDGKKLLYSVFTSGNGFRPTLWLTGAEGDNIGLDNLSLGLETWSYKCTVAGDNQYAYCGVPGNLPQGSGFYPELAKDVYDDFYRIDLTSGQASLLAVPAGDLNGYSVEQIFLAPDGRTLYFKDANTANLYSLNLE